LKSARILGRRLVLYAGALIYLLQLHRVFLRATRRNLRVLVYHACDPEENDYLKGLDSNTTPAAFERQMRFVKANYNAVGLDALTSGSLPDCPLHITFDDGYRSVHDHAWPVLRALSLPATIYLIGSVVEDRPLVWVNEVNWYVNRHPEAVLDACRMLAEPGAPRSARAVLPWLIASRSPAQVARVLDHLRGVAPAAPASPLYLGRSEIEAMARAGMTFGNHTQTHPNLALLDDAQQEAEVMGGRDGVRRALGEWPSSLAYPFGQPGERARQFALETGHTTIMELGGYNPVELDRAHVGRVLVTQEHPALLFAEIEIVPRVRALLRRVLGRARA
jgi:peptidoglycan/xylan/chitin deacetylase (PgdA/CDA1 family)